MASPTSKKQKVAASWDLNKFLVPEQRPSKDHIQKLINEMDAQLHHQQQHAMGYQCSQYFDFKNIAHMLDMSCNNIGDPFQKGLYRMNTKEMEYAVVRYYAKLWGFPMRSVEIDEAARQALQPDDAYWGYVLSMGSSEGNLMAFWVGRDYVGGKYLIIDKEKNKMRPMHVKRTSAFRLPGATKSAHIDELKPTVYFASSASHYSIFKSAVIMHVPSFDEYGNEHDLDAEIPGVKAKGQPFPHHVPVYSDFDGRTDADKLLKLVRFFAERHHGIIVSLNYGTTFSGAFDELHTIIPALRTIFSETGLHDLKRELIDPDNEIHLQDTRRGYWIHVDGALGGAYVPYLVQYAEKNLKTASNPDPVVDTVTSQDGTVKEYRLSDIPRLDLRLYPEISSTVTSGHKFPGAPWPCGVFMTHHKYQLYPPSAPMYIGSMDSTLSGSRNSVSPLLLWSYLMNNTEADIEKETWDCLQVAKGIEAEIAKVVQEKRKNPGIPMVGSRAPFSLSLVFSRLRDELTHKYTLAQQDIGQNSFNHLFAMSQVNKHPWMLQDLYADMRTEKAFDLELLHHDKTHKTTKKAIELGHGTW